MSDSTDGVRVMAGYRSTFTDAEGGGAVGPRKQEERREKGEEKRKVRRGEMGEN